VAESPEAWDTGFPCACAPAYAFGGVLAWLRILFTFELTYSAISNSRSFAFLRSGAFACLRFYVPASLRIRVFASLVFFARPHFVSGSRLA
jgi:hypothetical protein